MKNTYSNEIRNSVSNIKDLGLKITNKLDSIGASYKSNDNNSEIIIERDKDVKSVLKVIDNEVGKDKQDLYVYMRKCKDKTYLRLRMK